MLTGLSLSFCITDISKGLISPLDVEQIVTGTMCSTPRHWEECLAKYAASYWAHDPDTCQQIARELMLAGKIIQPRVFGGDPPAGLGSGHWVDNETGRKFQITAKRRIDGDPFDWDQLAIPPARPRE